MPNTEFSHPNIIYAMVLCQLRIKLSEITNRDLFLKVEY